MNKQGANMGTFHKIGIKTIIDNPLQFQYKKFCIYYFKLLLDRKCIMKIPFGRSSDSVQNRDKFVCKVCKMSFQSKESMERHRNKAKHFGSVHL